MSTKTRKKARTTQQETSTSPSNPKAPRSTAGSRSKQKDGLGGVTKALGAIVLGVLALAAVFYLSNRESTEGTGQAGAYKFVVGEPKPGQEAPALQLPSTDGDMFDLADHRGETVLLYFQEGIMCQPCWDQVKDIEQNYGKFEQLGIDQLVTVTTDPLDALKQKVADEKMTTPVLADPGVGASEAWGTAGRGMMGASMNGHSFVLVNEEGVIEWRADYGGAPDYTMYVPVSNILADLRAGLNEQSS